MSEELPDDYYEPTICKTPLPKMRVSYEQLESALSAEQEARKAAEYKLSLYSLTPANYEWTIAQLSQRAEAAEARIKASREQEPVAFVQGNSNDTIWYIEPYVGMQLYAQPPIPPDVAELQRQLEEARKVPEGLISVAVKLPETKYEMDGHEVSQSVLLFGKCVAGYDGHGVGHYTSDGKWVCYEGEYDNQNIVEVTHWMPLPAAPTTDQPKE